MEANIVVTYGEDNPECTGRIYILYTGTHYDTLVGQTQVGDSIADVRLFPTGEDPVTKALVLELAAVEQAAAVLKAKQRTRKVIQCSGCGAQVADSEAFQTHCMEVEHDDDFGPIRVRRSRDC